MRSSSLPSFPGPLQRDQTVAMTLRDAPLSCPSPMTAVVCQISFLQGAEITFASSHVAYGKVKAGGGGGTGLGRGCHHPTGVGTGQQKPEARKARSPQRVLIKGVLKPLCLPNFRCLSPAPGAGKAGGERAGNAEVR